jgi:hypothetical protein
MMLELLMTRQDEHIGCGVDDDVGTPTGHRPADRIGPEKVDLGPRNRENAEPATRQDFGERTGYLALSADHQYAQGRGADRFASSWTRPSRSPV